VADAQSILNLTTRQYRSRSAKELLRFSSIVIPGQTNIFFLGKPPVEFVLGIPSRDRDKSDLVLPMATKKNRKVMRRKLVVIGNATVGASLFVTPVAATHRGRKPKLVSFSYPYVPLPRKDYFT
jgi:hypothetical protein